MNDIFVEGVFEDVGVGERIFSRQNVIVEL
jgi:hypothetical protein